MRALATRTEADPRRLAWRVLVAVEEGAHADAELAARGASLALDSRDRGLATLLVYGTLAWQGYLDHAIASLGQSPARLDPPVRALLRMALFQLAKLSRVPEFAAVDTAVELAKEFRRGRARGLVNAVLRTFLRRGRAVPLPADRDDGIGRLSIELSHPRWRVERWIEELGGDDARALLVADNEAAPTVLRVNRRRTDRDAWIEQLAHSGVPAEATRFSPDGVRLQIGCDPSALPGFSEGRVTLQGEASQLVGLLLDPAPGGAALDACAAPGGKTTQIAERLGPGGVVVAVDRSAGGLVQLRGQARRLGLDGIETIQADARALPIAPERVFDAVLVDAPCSGLGTMRRHPEIRWRRSESDLHRAAVLQETILAAAAESVAPRGLLVYAVCSPEPEEGVDVVARFLAAHSDFVREDSVSTAPPEIGEDAHFATRMRKTA